MQQMTNFGISLPISCFTLVKNDGKHQYYKITLYGDWWWGKCDHLRVTKDISEYEDCFSYELGYFCNNKWVVMFGWGYDWENIMEGNK